MADSPYVTDTMPTLEGPALHSRPDMKARLEAFADQVASAGGEAGEMLVAAEGPQVLFASIKETLPAQVHVQRLTHPM